MFTGKKITSSFVNQQVEYTNGKLIETKITDQLLGKPKLSNCNIELKNTNMHMEYVPSTME
jgi:hypothetical protein